MSFDELTTAKNDLIGELLKVDEATRRAVQFMDRDGYALRLVLMVNRELERRGWPDKVQVLVAGWGYVDIGYVRTIPSGREDVADGVVIRSAMIRMDAGYRFAVYASRAKTGGFPCATFEAAVTEVLRRIADNEAGVLQ